MLTAFYLSKFEPEGNEGCHVNVVILDSGNTPAQHAQCHTTPAARFLEISNISGLFALLFFLQSGSVVLDCGQTPPQHAQCHITLAAQVQVFIFCPGSCLVAKESHIYSPNAALQH